MFTGLIEESGAVQTVRATATGRDVTVRVPASLRDAKIGDSVAVNGICLTVISREGDSFVCHAGSETLARSTAGDWQRGTTVNLEQALRVGDRLGGHFVQGHVDCVGTCVGRRPVGETTEFSFELPEEQAVYLAEKGSIALDGISLTIASLSGGRVTVAVIPHTLAQTTLANLQPGVRVNVEVDILAKYVRRSLGLDQGGITEAFLREHGFG